MTLLPLALAALLSQTETPVTPADPAASAERAAIAAERAALAAEQAAAALQRLAAAQAPAAAAAAPAGEVKPETFKGSVGIGLIWISGNAETLTTTATAQV